MFDWELKQRLRWRIYIAIVTAIMATPAGMAIIKGRLPFEESLLELPSADEDDDDGDKPLGLPSISRLL